MRGGKRGFEASGRQVPEMENQIGVEADAFSPSLKPQRPNLFPIKDTRLHGQVPTQRSRVTEESYLHPTIRAPERGFLTYAGTASGGRRFRTRRILPRVPLRVWGIPWY